jgi:hypothetical protein
LALSVLDPEGFLKILQADPYNFKLKGSGPLSFHLGCGFERDSEGVLCMNPKRYIEKMVDTYERMFGVKPGTKPYSPLEEGDHPEIDTSEFLDEEDIQKYQSLVGSMQWLITLGRWDIQTAVMTLSSFRSAPRKGHMERARRIYAYVNRFKDYIIRFNTEQPDLSALDGVSDHSWDTTQYGDHQEDIPEDAPAPLGKPVTLIHYFDANLMHDVLSGKAVTGCIHFANKTPIMWHSKKQATTETATYGAEFIAGRTCIEQIVDLRNTFRYLGVPIHNTSYVFGDNESMINSSTYPDARLHKRHNILSYHYVRSMIARGFIKLTHINSQSNLADVLSKHWSYNSVKGLLKPVFHYTGNTADLYIDDVSTVEADTASDIITDHQISDTKVNSANQWGVTKGGQHQLLASTDVELVNGINLSPRNPEDTYSRYELDIGSDPMYEGTNGMVMDRYPSDDSRSHPDEKTGAQLPEFSPEAAQDVKLAATTSNPGVCSVAAIPSLSL